MEKKSQKQTFYTTNRLLNLLKSTMYVHELSYREIISLVLSVPLNDNESF